MTVCSYIETAMRMTGEVLVILKCAKTGRFLDIQISENTLSPEFKKAVVRDLINGTQLSKPIVMAFSRDVISSSPFPTAFTNEFRAPITNFASDNSYFVVSVLASSEGNSGGGNIKSIGFYYGSDASLTVGTGTLGSVINTLNVAKTSAIEVTFQYKITYG